MLGHEVAEHDWTTATYFVTSVTLPRLPSSCHTILAANTHETLSIISAYTLAALSSDPSLQPLYYICILTTASRVYTNFLSMSENGINGFLQN